MTPIATVLPLNSTNGFQKILVMCFSFADRAEPDSNDFFFLVLYFFFSFCIIDYLQFLVTYMSGKSLEDNQVKCESPLLTKPLGYIVLL